jgi:transcription-repair coupling factor (superfamily II helicase)
VLYIGAAVSIADDAHASVPSTLESGLARPGASLGDAAARISAAQRVDLSGLPPSAAALLLARLAAQRPDERHLVLVADNDAARRIADDLRFFSRPAAAEPGAAGGDEPPSDVLVYPSADTSPYVDVAPDRRAAMERLSTLFHLAEGLPWRFVVASAPAIARRVPPRHAIAARSQVVRVEEGLDRAAFLRLLAEGGYLRVPVVEDPGTFAVRGAILDVFPPHARRPARIELDDYLVLSIKLFDPEDQRTVREVRELFVHPVREGLLGPAEIDLARAQVRTLCEQIDLPSSRTRQLVEDIESGRAFMGLEGFLPAFYRELDTLFDYLTPGRGAPPVRTVVLDPTDLVRSLAEQREQAEGDLEARRAERAPVFPLEAHFVDDEAISARLAASPLVVVHRLAVGGALGEEETSPLARLETVREDDLLPIGGEDVAGLTLELKLARARGGRDDHLVPLANRTRAWLEDGLRVLVTTRTTTQAERLVSLLRGYEVPVAPRPALLDPRALTTRPPGHVEVVIGALGGGFVLPREALAVVTEEEIFGSRAAQRAERGAKKRKKKSAEPFLEDLRQLAPGDYLVHAEHGIGRYLGLERKATGRSRFDEMRGLPAVVVEVLVVEYAGGDKLFVPVTRLHQVQKFRGGEGAAPKLDRLGGQTFSKTKQRVRKAVQQLADELLRLYAARAASKRPALPPPERAFSEFEATFPFDETADQARAIEEVLADLVHAQPMDRIVCGDVGFGKTEVAIRAAFRVALTGRQVAVLCPTTVLAQQHFRTFQERMREWPVRVEVLSRFVEKEDQTTILQGVKDGRVDVVVGTHRLLSKDVHFKQLGLVVVDEEQRFGVTHKERLKKLKTDVDVLTLSATPIPRTLQLAVGGLRDLSLITTPPADRRAIRTYVVRWDDHLLKEAIEREVKRGGQVFFVYNRIEGLYERAAKLQQLVPSVRIAVGHGQMPEGALEKVMTDFVEGRYDVLCATTIIESGLDIPRANTMIIDRADTFGLAQLYQLRGRVGRSRERAYCYLVSPPPSTMTDEARARIEALERFTELGSGFKVASLDMELRGAGDLLGAEQSGSVAAVGFDMFVHLLEEAVAELKGEPIVHEVDTELTLDVEQVLPADFVEDVGLRLSLYKRLSSAEDEGEVQELAQEIEDRFGPPPPPARALFRVMSLRPRLRAWKVLGCEANAERVTLHLREDTPLDPAKVMRLVTQPQSPWKLTPDMKLSRRFTSQEPGDAIDHVGDVLRALGAALKDEA